MEAAKPALKSGIKDSAVEMCNGLQIIKAQ